jgi:anti-sigma regulatory factor (Ser/Thr protein kinase)
LPENVALVRAAVGERAEAYGLEDEVIADLKTVVSEASANVVLHAYAGAADPGPLEVEMTRDATTVRVVVRDRGLGIRSQPKSTREPQDGAVVDWRDFQQIPAAERA